eukprot:Rhum_TRINITY_DN13298_c0_g1::Rhum_TRINITY_DN13298_c0_g1_i1::g.58739::m.58739
MGGGNSKQATAAAVNGAPESAEKYLNGSVSEAGQPETAPQPTLAARSPASSPTRRTPTPTETEVEMLTTDATSKVAAATREAKVAKKQGTSREVNWTSDTSGDEKEAHGKERKAKECVDDGASDSDVVEVGTFGKAEAFQKGSAGDPGHSSAATGGGRRETRLSSKRYSKYETQTSGDGASGDEGGSSVQQSRSKKKLLNGTKIEFRYPSGSRYVGGFLNGKLHGHGVYTYYPSGDQYEGQWFNDMKHGTGTYLYESGDRYTGEWRCGKKQGKGTYTFGSGDEYCGNWKSDKIHGYGVFIIVRNGNQYEGDWEDSFRHGYGILQSGNGDRYEGQWARGKEEGLGSLEYANGNVYCGEWKQGQMDGKGVMFEGGRIFLVEHISGYMISSVAADPMDIEAEWANVWQFAQAYRNKEEGQKAVGGTAGGAASAGQTLQSAADLDAYESVVQERDALRAQVKQLSAQRAESSARASEAVATLDAAGQKEKLVEMMQRSAEDETVIQALKAQLARSEEQLSLQSKQLDSLKNELDAVHLAYNNATTLASHNPDHLLQPLRRDSLAEGSINRDPSAVETNDNPETPSAEEAGVPHSTGHSDSQNKTRVAQLEAQLRTALHDLHKSRADEAGLLQKCADAEQELKKERLNPRKASEREKELALKAVMLEKKVAGLEAQLKDLSGKASDSLELQARLEIAEASAMEIEAMKRERDKAIESKQGALNERDSLKQREADLLLEIRVQKEKAQAVQEQINALSEQHQEELATFNTKDEDKAHEREVRVAELEEKAKKAKKKAKEMEKQLGTVESKLAAQQAVESELGSKLEAIKVESEDAKKRFDEKSENLEREAKKEKEKARQLHNIIEDMKGKIRVYVRTRPFLQSEKSRRDKRVIDFPDNMTIQVEAKHQEKRQFLFDTAFDEPATQVQVFSECQHLIQSAVDGFNVCIFAYGQTGSGKTFTLSGDDSNPGVAPRAMAELAQLVSDMPLTTYTLQCFMVELYNDKLYDLLLEPVEGEKVPRLDIKKDSKGTVTIPGVSIVNCDGFEDLSAAFVRGQASRRVRSTKMNDVSSRSHLVFSILVETTNTETKQTACGKLSIVDLAGSERLAKTGVEDPVAVAEAQSINLSLTTLGNVISALSSGQKHVPYRDNKLTMLMSDSLGGNAKTLMFVNVSPSGYNTDETLSSLNYASRVKLIKNNPAKTIETAEIKRLKALVAQLRQESSASGVVSSIGDDFQEIAEFNQYNAVVSPVMSPGGAVASPAPRKSVIEDNQEALAGTLTGKPQSKLLGVVKEKKRSLTPIVKR